MPSPSEASTSCSASPEPAGQHAEDVLKGPQDTKSSAFSSKSFAELGVIPALLEALDVMKFTKPTEIQAQAIPPALGGRDIIGVAETVSGYIFLIYAKIRCDRPFRVQERLQRSHSPSCRNYGRNPGPSSPVSWHQHGECHIIRNLLDDSPQMMFSQVNLRIKFRINLKLLVLL